LKGIVLCHINFSLEPKKCYIFQPSCQCFLLLYTSFFFSPIWGNIIAQLDICKNCAKNGGQSEPQTSRHPSSESEKENWSVLKCSKYCTIKGIYSTCHQIDIKYGPLMCLVNISDPPLKSYNLLENCNFTVQIKLHTFVNHADCVWPAIELHALFAFSGLFCDRLAGKRPNIQYQWKIVPFPFPYLIPQSINSGTILLPKLCVCVFLLIW
jgi:hypothetical protein